MRCIGRCSCLLFMVLVLNCITKGQNQPEERHIAEVLEYLETNEQEINESYDISEISESITNYIHAPLRINLADKPELLRFPFFDERDAISITEYVNRYGAILSIFELLVIDGFDRKKVLICKELISLETNMPKEEIQLRKIFDYPGNKLIFKYESIAEKQAGFKATLNDQGENQNPKYQGDPSKFYIKYQYAYHSTLKAGITAEKDKGEAFTKNGGFDFYSGYIQYQDPGKKLKIILGDHHLQFGQGLVCWTGFGAALGGSSGSEKKYGSGIKKYSSSTENGYLRGLGLQYNTNSLISSISLSSVKDDANINQYDSINGKVISVSSLQNTGYHRTESEIYDKDAIRINNISGVLTYVCRTYSLGISFLATKLSADLNRNDTPENRYDFAGTKNINNSFHFNIILRKLTLYGEIAKKWPEGFAGITGINIYPGSGIRINAMYWNYSKKYHSFYGKAYSIINTIQAESGYHASMFLEAGKGYTYTGTIDYAVSDLVSTLCKVPQHKFRHHHTLRYIGNNLRIGIWYKNSKKTCTTSSDIDQAYQVDEQRSSSFKIKCTYNIQKNLILQHIVALSWSGPFLKNYGNLLIQDMRYTFRADKGQITLRYCLFDTKTYNDRLYVYENDLLYTFSIPALFDEGYRYYVLFKYKLSKSLRIGIKVGRTTYLHKHTIGTGYDEIQGNTKTRIKAQLIMKF